MGIVWFLVACFIAALSYVFMTNNSPLPIWALWIYAWIPGGLGLLWARLNKTKISFTPRDKLYLFYPVLGGFAVGALSFFIGQVFYATTSSEIASFKNAILYFFSYYGVFLFLFFLLFVGGEICWRGYLWEKWKSHPFIGGIAIWLLWSMWLAPVTLAFSKNIFSMAFFNLSLMPLLHFLRVKSQSIVPGTVFYSSLCASSIYLQILFSSVQDYLLLSAVQGGVLLIIALAFILMKKNKKKNLL